jgi:hypothetical protein
MCCWCRGVRGRGGGLLDGCIYVIPVVVHTLLICVEFFQIIIFFEITKNCSGENIESPRIFYLSKLKIKKLN